MLSASAKLIAAGVRLPDFFVTVGGELWHTTPSILEDFPDLPPVRIDHQTRAGLLRQLAMWAGDDGKAQAYWLHFCESEGVWSLRDNRNSTSIVVEFDTLERAEDDRIDFLWDLIEYPPLHKATWLCGIEGHDEALVAIIEHIGRDHEVRRALGWKVDAGTLAEFACHAAGEWSLHTGPCEVRVFSSQERTARKLNIVMHIPALAGVTDPAEAMKAIYTAVCSG